MDKEQFRSLFVATLQAAVVQAQDAHQRQLPRELVIELHGAEHSGARMSPDQAVEKLFIKDGLFWRIIDVAVIGANAQSTVMFVRASGHDPSPWAQTWDPEGNGPFKVLVAATIRTEPSNAAVKEAPTMVIQHHAIVSQVFELMRTIEFDIEIVDDHFSIRVELFRSTSDQQIFRVRLWRSETYRLNPVFPLDPATGEPAVDSADASVFMESEAWLAGDYREFRADSPGSALQVVLDDFRRWLVVTIGEEPSE